MKKLQEFIERRAFGLMELTGAIWWITFIITIVPALFLTNLYDNLAFLWIIGVPMIIATLIVEALDYYLVFIDLSLSLYIGFLLLLTGILFIAPAIILASRSIWWLWLCIAPIIIWLSLFINYCVDSTRDKKDGS